MILKTFLLAAFLTSSYSAEAIETSSDEGIAGHPVTPVATSAGFSFRKYNDHSVEQMQLCIDDLESDLDTHMRSIATPPEMSLFLTFMQAFHATSRDQEDEEFVEQYLPNGAEYGRYQTLMALRRTHLERSMFDAWYVEYKANEDRWMSILHHQAHYAEDK